MLFVIFTEYSTTSQIEKVNTLFEFIAKEVEEGNNEAIHELNNPGVPQHAELSEQHDAAIPICQW